MSSHTSTCDGPNNFKNLQKPQKPPTEPTTSQIVPQNPLAISSQRKKHRTVPDPSIVPCKQQNRSTSSPPTTMHTKMAHASLRRSRTQLQQQLQLTPELYADADGNHVLARRAASDNRDELRRSFPSESTALLRRSMPRAASVGSPTHAENGVGDLKSYGDRTSVSVASDSGVTPLPPRGTVREDIVAIYHLLVDQKLNVLLLLGPLALYASLRHWGDSWVFLLNFLVMIPLANLLGEATESLAFHTGETIGGLVNATFGNAVEVVVAIFALREGEIKVVQSSLIGSVLSNLLLVLGCSFIAGGITKSENTFNAVGASANSSLLILASFGMLLPSYIYYFSDATSEEDRVQQTLALSHITAIFLLFMYMQLLYFQLHTHLHLFQEDGDGDEDEVDLSKRASIVVLLVSTLLVALFSEFLVGSIDGFAKELHVSKSFIGIILLPIVGNAVEHVTAVKVALHDKMELAMGVAVGSATQVSLFVVPVVVIAGWAMGQPMTLAFPAFEIMVFLMSILIVYAIIADGKSNWLEGSMLLTAYALVAVSLLWVKVPSV